MTGRAIGGDKIAHAATRNMACCAVVSQGAGVAAAQAVARDVALDAVDVAAVQEVLRDQGVRVQ